MGVVGWCVSLRWQVKRECRWCSQEGPIDRKFINIRILHLLVLYVLPLHLFSILREDWHPRFQECYLAYLVFQSAFSVFPACLHLQLGQRIPPQKNFPLWDLWDYYGDFGSESIHYSPSERKKRIRQRILNLACILLVMVVSNILLGIFIPGE
ncbi:hypothetical protein [Pasteuria penetrans]|uniref:hypothetical protein n=1 Tax=Pasteuria penetrans TaxID=86005 RepID=UPI001CAA482C|nr:hypothetical protein [Pasteuria penetrans]